ncbi:hypothetical protein DBA20_06535 [Pandoraea capi]|nr:hypothetical protein [Pandoraea sp. LA3]MDN4582639.1 hypothetical protein [Pandoraea capi]
MGLWDWDESEMRGRIKGLADVELDPRKPWVDMEAQTRINGRRWQNVARWQQRASDDMLEANRYTSSTLARIGRGTIEAAFSYAMLDI